MSCEPFSPPRNTGPEVCGECRHEYDVPAFTWYNYGPEIRHVSLADCLRAALRRTAMLEYKTKDLESRVLLAEKAIGRSWWKPLRRLRFTPGSWGRS